MAELIALGMDPVAASKQAINDVLYPIKRFTEQAATAAAHVREKDFLADCAPENRAAARCGTKFWREAPPRRNLRFSCAQPVLKNERTKNGFSRK